MNWVPASNGSIPSTTPVCGGIDNGLPVYVIRAAHEGGVVPGKLHGGTAYIPYGGGEIVKHSYEVLTCPPGVCVGWVTAAYGNVPCSAIVGGKDPCGDTYYIGRANIGGHTAIGKVHPGHGTCYVPYDGVEQRVDKYEVLAKNC